MGIPWYKKITFLKTTEKYYREEITKCPLMPQSRETLAFLKKHGKIGLSTNTPYEEIVRRLDGRGDFLELFGGDANIIAGDRVKNYKPDPEGLHILIDRWGLPANKIFMVGDMITDLQAAQSAGCRTIAVLSGFNTRDQLEKHHPDFLPEIVDSVS